MIHNFLYPVLENASEMDTAFYTRIGNLWDCENHEHLKIFRNVDCLRATYNKVQECANKPQNHKLITVAVCVLVILGLG